MQSQTVTVFPDKYHDFGIDFVSLIPKKRTFDYHKEKLQNPNNPFNYWYYFDVKVKQHFNSGLGFHYNRYRKLKASAITSPYTLDVLYLSFGNNLNLYTQKFNKQGEEFIYGEPPIGFSSQIKEMSYNVLYEPSFNLSYQRKIADDYILNLETGLGLNIRLFSYIDKKAYNPTNQKHYSDSYYSFTINPYAKIPLKIELIKKIGSKRLGLAVSTQITNTYYPIKGGRDYISNSDENADKHIIGFNSPSFVYNKYKSNNYPTKSFNLNVSLSIKI